MRYRCTFLLGIVFLLGTNTAEAQTAISDAAALATTNRAQLIAAAQEEGSVDVYSTVTVEDMALLGAAFEEKYGIRINLWRSSASGILQRAVTEANAGRYSVDVIEAPGSELEAINREGLLQEISLPVYAQLMDGAAVPGRAWVASRLIIFAAGYNTNLVHPADVPKTYRDLLDPKWRGKIGIEATDFSWFMSLTDAMGGEPGLQLFRDIQAANGFSVRMGHTLMGNMVISGEVPLGLNLYRHFLEPVKQDGAPINYVYLDPVMAVPSGAAVTRHAPHPHAAILFMEFLLDDAQAIYETQDNTATNLTYQNLPDDLDLHFVDVSKYVDEIEKWRPLYRDIIGGTE
ncbi:MAG: Fe(3+)-binding periplasmic protein precursor [Pseudomonadota bacterium]|jgi:iron(III) transport system substrate-binding protein